MPNTTPETSHFDELAHQWWDANGAFRGLHDINPLRLEWIEQTGALKGMQVADIGCGGGLLAEGMASRGAMVTGIDLSEKSLAIAKLHLLESGQEVDYRSVSVESLANEMPASFDLVTCFELLEHVPDPERLVQTCAHLVKPGGTVCFSTLNRTPKAYLLAILAAERLLGIVPKGMHQYEKFIKPSELARWATKSGLETVEITGMVYEPFNRKCRLSCDTSVNYLLRTFKS